MADSNIQTLDTVKPITLDEYQERTAHLQENTTSLLSTIADRQVQAAGLATQAASLASEVNAVAEQASISFSKKTWADTATSGTPITAADLNRLENAISSLTTAVNNLQDSVTRAVLLLSEELTVNGGKMLVEVYDIPAIKELVMRVNGSFSTNAQFFQDYYTTNKIPKDKLPSVSVNCALPAYEGTWGRFCARGCILDDGSARLSLMVPQAMHTGYTSECHISYAF